MATYHPDDDTLISFAAGKLTNPLGLILACHLQSCPQCRQRAMHFEAIAGELLFSLPATQLSSDAWKSMQAKLTSQETSPSLKQSKYRSNSIVPVPLQRFAGNQFERVKWTGITRIKSYTLPIADRHFSVRLLKIPAGVAVPMHTHAGLELTQVICGGFSDGQGHYLAGDFVEATPHHTHQPVADKDSDCICLAVQEGPIRMTGPLLKWFNPFLA